MAKFTAVCRSVGNPDFGENPNKSMSPTKAINADSLKELSAKAMRYRDLFGLGGGNWCEPEVKSAGRVVGKLAYNGRVFGPGYWTSETPILFDPLPKELAVKLAGCAS